MKTIFACILGLFLTKGLSAQDTLKIQTSAECESCKERIENRLNFTKGVKTSNLDLSNKVVTVIYDKNKVTPEEIRKAINKTGYDADSSKAEAKAYNKLPNCCKKGGMSGK